MKVSFATQDPVCDPANYGSGTMFKTDKGRFVIKVRSDLYVALPGYSGPTGWQPTFNFDIWGQPSVLRPGDMVTITI